MSIAPNRITEIAKDKYYIGLTCWHCLRFLSWEGGALRRRFYRWPDLTASELKQRAHCYYCGKRGELTFGWAGNKVHKT